MHPLTFLNNMTLPHDVVHIGGGVLEITGVKCKYATQAVDNIFSLTNQYPAIQMLSSKDKSVIIKLRDLYTFVREEHALIQEWAEMAVSEKRSNISVEEFAYLFRKIKTLNHYLDNVDNQRIYKLIPAGATQFALTVSENSVHDIPHAIMDDTLMPLFNEYQQKIMNGN